MREWLADARARAYLSVLSWLGDGHLRHCDVARDRDGAVVAVTFARDLGYLDSLRQIEAIGSPPGKPFPDGGTERKLRRKVALLTSALALLGLAMVLEELAERLFR